MDQRITLQPAFILHSRPYGDSSAIIEVFTRDYGRVALLAKGIRTRKKNTANLQSFVELLVTWQGRGELKTLTGVEQSRYFSHFVGRQLFAALYVNEVLMRVLQKFDAHPVLFGHYQTLVKELQAQPNVEPCLRIFEIHLLAELGYGINVFQDALTGDAILRERNYRYIPDQGFFPMQGPELSATDQFAGADILAIAASDFSSVDTRRAAKRLMRLALAPHLGHRPLKSRELFLQPVR